MINNLVRICVYFVICVLFQVWVLNNIHYLQIATPFLYIYSILKLPLGTSGTKRLLFAFLLGCSIDLFSNTPGLHAAACTLMGFIREPLIRLLQGDNELEGCYPSYHNFGYKGFIRYAGLLILVHHICLYFLEAMSLFDPLFLFLRIVGSCMLTLFLVCIVELLNFETQKVSE